MNKNGYKINIVSLILTVISIYLFLHTNLKNEKVYAMESQNQSTYSSSNERNNEAVFIEGTINNKLAITEFTNIKFIPNANYFLINPRHKENDGVDNKSGVCVF